MTHFERLEDLYAKAPIHRFYEQIKLLIEEGKTTISLPIDERYFHGAMAIHGSVYFKLLDDAAYFACQSKTKDFFLLTKTFTVDLKRPVTSGILTAKGEIVQLTDELIIGRATLTNEDGKICATGSGEFRKSKISLFDLNGYAG